MKNQKAKTLYITDLDGTLLHYDERISIWSCDTLNQLISEGMLFSYATARSISTASIVTQGLSPKLPVIVNNGSFIMDAYTRKRIVVNQFTANEARKIYTILQRYQITPLVYAIIDNHERFSYDEKAINSAVAEFVETRKNDGRNNPLNDTRVILQGEVFYFTCIGEEEKLRAAYTELKISYNCIFQFDIYSHEPWLEIMPHSASKAHAILQLKEQFYCSKVVVFGDGVNDIPMFRVADEGYATENAINALKEIATAVIDSNENDGVAKWLLQNVGFGI
ncbi:5-amino-6-(5-phospho-D-ribitylamino)uracil phosphatase YitU [Lachnospiraceae bacterium]|nr:5-amino-6-(5-phospho-D-ribitylamino)uracil phosphatase YitU [Lachnospiraceae bacterium]